MEDSFKLGVPELDAPTTKLGKIKKNTPHTISIVVFFLLVYFFFLSAPSDFQNGTIVDIEQGASLRNVSRELKKQRIIRSQTAFEAFVIIFGGEKRINYSDYLFENKLPVWQVARRIAKGERHLASIKVTIPEGFNVSDMSKIFALKLPSFNEDKFKSIAKDWEGYLFPDTYFFFITDNEKDVLKIMRENFEKKISSVRSEITLSGKSEKDIIKMASLIEGEAEGNADREFISGILWKRLALGMPLQVDSAPDTYKTKELPKNPISNPGLQAIKAAIFPQNSPYLFYLHDKNGGIHYAKNFEEHKKNKLKYLR